MQASLRYALLKLLKCLTDDEAAATETSTQQTNAKIVEAQLNTQNLCNKPFYCCCLCMYRSLARVCCWCRCRKKITRSQNVDQDSNVSYSGNLCLKIIWMSCFVGRDSMML